MQARKALNDKLAALVKKRDAYRRGPARQAAAASLVVRPQVEETLKAQLKR